MKRIIYWFAKWATQTYSELHLFYQGPKRYLYLFAYPKNKKIKIENHDPRITKIGKTLVGKIRKTYPELKIHFIGSSALGIPGERDIDLFIECVPKNFHKYLPGLIRFFGEPIKRKRKFIQWERTTKSCSIDVILIDPSESLFRMCMHDFKVLKKDKNYLEEYKKLKQESNGLSIREYQKKKLIFFNSIWSLASQEK